MPDPCSNTVALNNFEHQNMLADRDLDAALSEQRRAGIDPLEMHSQDVLESFEFYEHVADALTDNGLIEPLLVLLMCGRPGEGAGAVRELVGFMARLHAQRVTDDDSGLYVPRYEEHDADVGKALEQLQAFKAGLTRD